MLLRLPKRPFIFLITTFLILSATAHAQDEKRRALPPPFASPPFPSAEYQGYPLVGVPGSDTVYPFMKWVYSTRWGEAIKKARINAYGWINGSGNISNCRHSNMPYSYWLVPNRVELDQLVLRLERQVDSVQTDHIDWIPFDHSLWDRLSLHDSRRLDKQPIVQTQLSLWI